MIESGVWKIIRDACAGPAWDFVRVENPAAPGTPDVNWACRVKNHPWAVEGWFELKHVDHWPVRLDTPLKIPHYTPQQRIWARRRRRVGGRCDFVARVGDDWFVLDGVVAADLINSTPKAGIIAAAVLYMPGRFDPVAFKRTLLR